jgi:hypothetical protein
MDLIHQNYTSSLFKWTFQIKYYYIAIKYSYLAQWHLPNTFKINKFPMLSAQLALRRNLKVPMTFCSHLIFDIGHRYN